MRVRVRLFGKYAQPESFANSTQRFVNRHKPFEKKYEGPDAYQQYPAEKYPRGPKRPTASRKDRKRRQGWETCGKFTHESADYNKNYGSYQKPIDKLNPF